MVRITMVNRRGEQTLQDVEGTLVEVVGRLSRAHDGLLNFGQQWRRTVVYVEDVVAVEPVHPALPQARTRAEILAEAAERERRARDQARAAEHRRAACAGGSRLIVCPPGGVPTHYLLARPPAEVVWALVTAGRDVVHLDDGLGGNTTVRIPHVEGVQAL